MCVQQSAHGGILTPVLCSSSSSYAGPQGILAALLLSILGATEDQIVADYIKSDEWHHVALAGIEDDSRVAKLDRAKFERAPAEAMRHALQHVKSAHGGVEAYLESAGVTKEQMRRIREALLRPGAGGGAGSGGAGGAGAAQPKL